MAILDFEMAMELSENIIIDIERCRLYVLKAHLGQGRLQNSKPGGGGSGEVGMVSQV